MPAVNIQKWKAGGLQIPRGRFQISLRTFAAYVSPELELFHIQPTQSTGKEVGFAPTPCGKMRSCLLQEGMKECSEPEAGQAFSCAFYSYPGFPQSLQIWAPSYHLPVTLSGRGEGEQSEGELVIKWTTQPWSARCPLATSFPFP